MSDLKLIALDVEDLDILSAHLQDAVLTVADMAYLPRERRFAAIANRFDWAAATPAGRQRARQQRRRTAFRMERVTAARLHGIDIKVKDRVLVLLSMQFAPGASPAGTVTLQFAGGAAMQLDVECIEAQLLDLGAVWAARSRPDHDDGNEKPEIGNQKSEGHEPG